MSKYKSMNTHIREAQGCNFMYCTYCDDFAIYRSHVKMITQRRLIYCQRLDNGLWDFSGGIYSYSCLHYEFVQCIVPVHEQFKLFECSSLRHFDQIQQAH